MIDTRSSRATVLAKKSLAGTRRKRSPVVTQGNTETRAEAHQKENVDRDSLRSGSRAIVLCEEGREWRATIKKHHVKNTGQRRGYKIHYDGTKRSVEYWVPEERVVASLDGAGKRRRLPPPEKRRPPQQPAAEASCPAVAPLDKAGKRRRLPPPKKGRPPPDPRSSTVAETARPEIPPRGPPPPIGGKAPPPARPDTPHTLPVDRPRRVSDASDIVEQKACPPDVANNSRCNAIKVVVHAGCFCDDFDLFDGELLRSATWDEVLKDL